MLRVDLPMLENLRANACTNMSYYYPYICSWGSSQPGTQGNPQLSSQKLERKYFHPLLISINFQIMLVKGKKNIYFHVAYDEYLTIHLEGKAQSRSVSAYREW